MKKIILILLFFAFFINLIIAETLPARISKINGHVILQRASATSEELGILNLPIETGDSLFVKEGYIDIDIEDGSTIRLWEMSNSVFLDVGNSNNDNEISTLLYSYSGKYELFAASGKSYIDLETKTGIITAFPNAVLIVDVKENGNIRIEVVSGSGAYKTPNEEKTINAGDIVELSSNGIGTIYQKPTQNNSAQNNSNLNNSNNSSPSRAYIPKKLYRSSSTLDDNGSWIYVSSHGYCWKPTISNWRPYKYGEWVWTSTWGYTWVSYEPWGWTTSHYGYWNWSRKYGWIWIPGSSWCSARVVWIWGHGYVGWYPYPYYNWHGWFPWWYPYDFWYCVSYHNFYSPSYRYHNPYYGFVGDKPPHRYERINTPDRISDISTEAPERPELSTERRIPEIDNRISENPSRNTTDNSRTTENTNNSRSGNTPSRQTDNSRNGNTNNSRSGYTPPRQTDNSRTYTQPNTNNNSRTNTNNNSRTYTQPNTNNNSRTNTQPNTNNNSRTNTQPNTNDNNSSTNTQPNNNSRTNTQPNTNNNSRTNERPNEREENNRNNRQ